MIEPSRRAALKAAGALAVLGVTGRGAATTSDDCSDTASSDCGCGARPSLPASVLELNGGTPACPVTVTLAVDGDLYGALDGSDFECIPPESGMAFPSANVTLDGETQVSATFRYSGNLVRFQTTDGDLDVDIWQRRES